MLAYCYALSYNNQKYETDPVDTNMDTLYQHAGMYGIGHKYDLPGLKHEAVQHFGNTSFSTTELVNILPFIYSTTPKSDRALRDAM